MRRFVAISVFFYAVIAPAQAAAAPSALRGLLTQFAAEPDRAEKQRILLQITTQYPQAGPDLLVLAQGPENGDTNWMAIQGIGVLKFRGAVPFLKSSLKSRSTLVRASAASSLGEIGDSSAIGPLIQALSNESESRVIEPIAYAFLMLHAREGIPSLKTKIGNPSQQTRITILGIVEVLGGRAELPFIAASLQDPSVWVRYKAAESIQRLSGQDFGFPACANGPCTIDDAAIGNAERWWLDHKRE